MQSLRHWKVHGHLETIEPLQKKGTINQSCRSRMLGERKRERESRRGPLSEGWVAESGLVTLRWIPFLSWRFGRATLVGLTGPLNNERNVTASTPPPPPPPPPPPTGLPPIPVDCCTRTFSGSRSPNRNLTSTQPNLGKQQYWLADRLLDPRKSADKQCMQDIYESLKCKEEQPFIHIVVHWFLPLKYRARHMLILHADTQTNTRSTGGQRNRHRAKDHWGNYYLRNDITIYSWPL